MITAADRLKALETVSRDLIVACDVAIEQMAIAFRDIERMRKRWDALSVKINQIATRAERLLPPAPPPKPQIRKKVRELQ